MNFDLNEDEQMLKAAVERFVADRAASADGDCEASSASGFAIENWHTLAELGILASSLPEELGGLELDNSAIAVIHEALGHGLVTEPVIENSILGAGLLLSHPGFSDWAEPLAEGSKRVALAHAERGSRGDIVAVETTAQSSSDSVTLNGHKPFVIAGYGCDGYIVSARSEGDAAAGDFSLYFVPADAAGLTSSSWRQTDGVVAAELTLDGVTVPSENEIPDGPVVLDRLETLSSLARSAQMLGIMERLFADTLEYLRTREQFGQPLGGFQALQHRMTAQYAKLAQSRALLELAIVSEDDFEVAVKGARAFIAKAALDLGHEAIQMHGGMGVTDELAIGHGHKRLLMLTRWPDDPRAAMDAYARISA
ncbi:acyl-CoA dehydrogenase family protein [Erythrobacter sp. SCSIO 43205]|uniref:acyl-CoA dehydrogenase family protein n=1 Tax=Erythrobacter sp. SCSIO 43205 TaxID=2779361 RepID=UPI001CA9F62E|nr:acyl-CoA dehydrogenase [Erythrobacter sp. SCSIO 43205]UAB79338.1 acyl-CoA dehydrogenase family protein [Erythrobacter sp. SCSIO 43205]